MTKGLYILGVRINLVSLDKETLDLGNYHLRFLNLEKRKSEV